LSVFQATTVDGETVRFSTLNPSKIIYFLMQALHYAARNGFASTCELLVRSGAALEAGAARNQATPLLLAVEGAAMLHAAFNSFS
jgi:hypothetical protein